MQRDSQSRDRDVMQAFEPQSSSLAGLRNTLLFRLLVLSLLPLIALSWYFRKRFIDTLEADSRALLHTIAVSHQTTIDRFIAGKVALLTSVAANGYLPLPPSREDLDRLLGFLQGIDETILDVGVFDAAGNHVRYAGPFASLEGRNYSGEAWFRTLSTSAGPAYISDVYRGYRDQPHFIIAVRMASAGRPWVLRITINPSRFTQMVSHVENLPGAHAYIVNDQGIFQSVPEAVGQPLAEAPPLPAATTPEGAFEMASKGGRYLVAFSRMREVGWTLVVRQELAAAYAPVARTRTGMVLIALVGAVLLVIASLYATETLVRRYSRSEQDRAQLIDQLVQAGKLSTLGEMAAGVAHEINNPLAVIHTEAGVMEDFLDPALSGEFNRAEFLEHLKSIREEVFRCRGITQKLLGFARRTESTITSQDLNRLVLDTVDLIRKELILENIRIELDLDQGLPGIRTDAEKIKQVLLNLLRNAADAIGKDGTITVSTLRG